MNRYRSAVRSYRTQRYQRHRHVNTNLWVVFQNGNRIGTVGGSTESEAFRKIPESVIERGAIALERIVIEE